MSDYVQDPDALLAVQLWKFEGSFLFFIPNTSNYFRDLILTD